MTRAPRGERRCHGCGATPEEKRFYRSRREPSGYQGRCVECESAAKKARAAEEVLPGWNRARVASIRNNYKMTPEEWEALFDSQGRRCAVCGSDTPDGPWWHTDHDHSCCPGRGKSCGECVRGILCGPCNMGLGSFKDDPERLRLAYDYLGGGR